MFQQPYYSLFSGQRNAPIVYSGTITGLRVSTVNGTAFVDNLPLTGEVSIDRAAVLHSGAVTQANMRLSTVAGTAFVDSDAGTFATNITAHLGKYLKVTDSANKSAYGWIKAAGTGETLDTELLTDMTNVGYDTFVTSGKDITSAISLSGNSFASSNGGNLTVGALYKYAYNLVQNSGLRPVLYLFGSAWEDPATYTLIAGANSYYRIAVSHGISEILMDPAIPLTGGNFSLIHSLKRVLTPSATGATIVSAKGGTTYNWESIDAGFNQNDPAGFTYIIYDRDITAFADGNHRIEVYCPTGCLLAGVLSSVGTEETLDVELFAQPLFDAETNLTIGTGWAVLDGKATGISATDSIRNTSLTTYTANTLVKTVITDLVVTSGTICVRMAGSNSTNIRSTSAGSYTDYLIRTISGTVGIQGLSAFTGSAEGFSAKKVLTPSTSGALIVSTKGGATANWTTNNWTAGSYNAATNLVVIRKLR